MYRPKNLAFAVFPWLFCAFVALFLRCSGDASFTVSANGTGGTAGGGLPAFPYAGTLYGFKFKTSSVTARPLSNNIQVTVPQGTDVTNLVGTFSFYGSRVTVNGVNQTNNVTPNNFSSPVTYSVYGSTLKNDYTVTVNTTTADIFPPVVTAVSPSIGTVSAFPTTVTFDVPFSDFGTGYSSAALIFCSPSYYSLGQGQYLIPTLTNVAGVLRGSVALQSYHEAGTWRVCYVSVTDAAGNYASYVTSAALSGNNYMYADSANEGIFTSDFTIPTVTVSGTVPDTTPPQLTLQSINPASASAFPASLTIRLDFAESASGFYAASATLCSPGEVNGTGTQVLYPSLTNMGTYLQGTVTAQNYHQSGNWKVCRVSLRDVAGNSIDYSIRDSVSTTKLSYFNGSAYVDSGVAIAQVTLATSGADTISPVLQSVTSTPSAVSTYPANVTIRIDYAESGSGLSYGYFNVCSPSRLAGNGGATLYSGSVTYGAGYLQGAVTFQSSHETGAWKVCGVTLVDNAGNRREYGYSRAQSTVNFSLVSPSFVYTDSGIPLGTGISKN